MNLTGWPCHRDCSMANFKRFTCLRRSHRWAASGVNSARVERSAGKMVNHLDLILTLHALEESGFRMSPTMIALQCFFRDSSIGRTSNAMMCIAPVCASCSISPCPISPFAPVTRIPGLRMCSAIGVLMICVVSCDRISKR